MKSKHLTKISKEMCRRVGADFKKINFKKRDWFMKYSWTEEQQEAFKKWMVQYLMDNSEARQEIMEHPIKNKKMIEKVANMFVFAYGWKNKE